MARTERWNPIDIVNQQSRSRRETKLTYEVARAGLVHLH